MDINSGPQTPILSLRRGQRWIGGSNADGAFVGAANRKHQLTGHGPSYDLPDQKTPTQDYFR